MTLTDYSAADALALKRDAHAVYLTDADHLRVTSWCANSGVTALTIAGRFLTCDGELTEFTFGHVPNTDRTSHQSTHALGEGWLLDVRVESNGAPLIGHVVVKVAVMRGLSGATTGLRVLAQGLCNAAQSLVWPGSLIVASITQPGAIRSVTGTDQAAGVEISETVPAGARWRIIGMRFPLVTNATVASREVSLRFDDGANIYFSASPAAQQAASLTRQYSAGETGARGQGSVSSDELIAIPPIILLGGHRITTSTTNLQPGDDFGAPQMLVEEWLEATA